MLFQSQDIRKVMVKKKNSSLPSYVFSWENKKIGDKNIFFVVKKNKNMKNIICINLISYSY